MRQLIIQVTQGRGEEVLQIAKSCDAVNVSKTQAQSIKQAVDLLIIHVSNRQVEDLLGKLEALPEVHITLLPSGVIALRPPASEAPQQVTNVQARSPIEIFLSGLQSVGSWRSFLAYAAVAGVVVWIGLYTEHKLSSDCCHANCSLCRSSDEYCDRNLTRRLATIGTKRAALLCCANGRDRDRVPVESDLSAENFH